jgi:ABC-type transport system involved in cytochrome c biogenesis permease subunit
VRAFGPWKYGGGIGATLGLLWFQWTEHHRFAWLLALECLASFYFLSLALHLVVQAHSRKNKLKGLK